MSSLSIVLVILAIYMAVMIAIGLAGRKYGGSMNDFMTAGGLVMILGGILWKSGTKQGAVASFLTRIACVIINKMGVQMPMLRNVFLESNYPL